MSEAAQVIPRMNVGEATFEPLEPYGSIAVLHESADRLKLAGAWNFGPGSFDYQLPYDLFVYVIEGNTSVQIEGADDLVLGAGDVAYLGSGSATTWEAPEEIRTVFFCISDGEPIDIYAA